jgi:spore germination protein KA
MLIKRRVKQKQKRNQKQSPTISAETSEKTISEVFQRANKSMDFSTISPLGENSSLNISFYKTMINLDILQQSVLPYLKEKASELKSLSDIKSILPIEDIKFTKDPDELKKLLPSLQ